MLLLLLVFKFVCINLIDPEYININESGSVTSFSITSFSLKFYSIINELNNIF